MNDVLLTVVAGALREWLLSRGEPVVGGDVGAGAGAGLDAGRGRRVRAAGSPRIWWTCRSGSPIRGSGSPGCATPCGAWSTTASRSVRTRCGADRVRAADAARARACVRPVGCPAGCSTSWSPTCRDRRSRCTPPVARLLEVFPVVPLVRGQGLSIGMTSYDGRVYVGLNADRDSVL